MKLIIITVVNPYQRPTVDDMVYVEVDKVWCWKIKWYNIIQAKIVHCGTLKFDNKYSLFLNVQNNAALIPYIYRSI